ncbi:hypothetical protein B0H16DRAFT_1893951 [Mycena metata]|uniref:Ubiquinol-cytochrome C reductase hinge domain-containing protein n=1 Tax=Mycena metata TaxID=1033252 RepID=A0AAD7MR97_9AGAR|nr:hypothetical protein B0H16DRAFT_1893951 [Mycena metata]
MSGLGSFLSSFFPSTHADSDSDDSKSDDSSKNESAPEAGDDAEAKDDGEGGGEGGAAEEEEEEPEDAAPGIRDACAARAECAPMKHHFEKCQEKIEAGKGFKGEECVEELCVVVSLFPTFCRLIIAVLTSDIRRRCTSGRPTSALFVY